MVACAFPEPVQCECGGVAHHVHLRTVRGEGMRGMGGHDPRHRRFKIGIGLAALLAVGFLASGALGQVATVTGSTSDTTSTAADTSATDNTSSAPTTTDTTTSTDPA